MLFTVDTKVFFFFSYQSFHCFFFIWFLLFFFFYFYRQSTFGWSTQRENYLSTSVLFCGCSRSFVYGMVTRHISFHISVHNVKNPMTATREFSSLQFRKTILSVSTDINIVVYNWFQRYEMDTLDLCVTIKKLIGCIKPYFL